MQLVFDASSLIVLTENCFSFLFENLFSSLKKTQLTLPLHVFEEAVSTPIKIKKFELNALRINELIKQGTLVVVKPSSESKALAQKIAFLANNLFFVNEKSLELMHLGECEALAISILNEGILCIEERTTRALIEQPLDLKVFLEQRQQVKIFVNQKNLEEFQRLTATVKIVRSADLLAFAFKKKIIAFKPDFLEASLFAMKYHGCAIGSDEILEFLKIKSEIKK